MSGTDSAEGLAQFVKTDPLVVAWIEFLEDFAHLIERCGSWGFLLFVHTFIHTLQFSEILQRSLLKCVDVTSEDRHLICHDLFCQQFLYLG